MKRIISTIVLIAFFSLKVTYAQVSVVAGGIAANEILEKFDETITSKISQAAGVGDYLLEKNYRELQMLLKSADNILKDNINTVFDELSEHEQIYLRTIEVLMLKMDKLSGDLLDLESFAAMDISALLGLIPGIKGELFLLRSMDYSLTYQESGVYNIRLTGQAFDHDNTVSITIDGQPIKLKPFSQSYVMEAEIPVSLVNNLFDSTSVERVNVVVKSWKTKKHWFKRDEQILLLEHKTELLLLPKYPVNYELVQVVKGQGWSEEIYSKKGEKLASRTGTSGKWNRYLVKVSIDENSLMIPSKTKTWVAAGVGPGSWGHWEGGVQYSDKSKNGYSTASRSFAHQIHDQDRTLAIEAFYRKPVDTYGRVPIFFKDPISQKEFSYFLQFGKLYEVKLRKEYITYYLRLKYFNGNEFILQEGSGYENIKIKSINKGGYNAFTIQIDKPY